MAAIGGSLLAGDPRTGAFAALRMPAWSPSLPAWIAVGLLYYAMMIAVLVRAGRGPALALPLLILTGNEGWSVFLFRLGRPDLAFRGLWPFFVVVLVAAWACGRLERLPRGAAPRRCAVARPRPRLHGGARPVEPGLIASGRAVATAGASPAALRPCTSRRTERPAVVASQTTTGPPHGAATPWIGRRGGRIRPRRGPGGACGAAGRGPSPSPARNEPWHSSGPPSGSRTPGPTSRGIARESCCTACAGAA